MVKIVLSVSLAFLYSIAYAVVGPRIEAQNISFDSTQLYPFLLCFLLCTLTNYALFSIVSAI